MAIHRAAPMRPLLKMSFFLPSSRKFFAPPIILNTKWGVGLVRCFHQVLKNISHHLVSPHTSVKSSFTLDISVFGPRRTYLAAWAKKIEDHRLVV